MALLDGNLNKCRIVFSASSILIGGVATGLPDTWAKIAFAVALGLSNVAVYIKSEQKTCIGGEK